MVFEKKTGIFLHLLPQAVIEFVSS